MAIGGELNFWNGYADLEDSCTYMVLNGTVKPCHVHIWRQAS